MTKLAILEEREEDKYDTVTKVKCWSCDSSQGKEIGQDVVDVQPQVRHTPTLFYCSNKSYRILRRSRTL
jgi:hypothetical protein